MGVDAKVNPNVEAEEAGGESQSKKAAKKLAKEAAKAAKVKLSTTFNPQLLIKWFN